MKKLLAICIMALILMSCTENNGNIGPIFGCWKLDSITIGTDSHRLDSYKGDKYFAFQNNCVAIIQTVKDAEAITTYGKWDMTSNGYMNFIFRGEKFPDLDSFEAQNNYCLVKELNNKRFVFTFVRDNEFYTYYLEKWN